MLIWICAVLETVKELAKTKKQPGIWITMPINQSSNTPRGNFSHSKSKLCQHTMMENNKDVILHTEPLTAIELSLYDHKVISMPNLKAYYYH